VRRWITLLVALVMLMVVPGNALADAPERFEFGGDSASAFWFEEDGDVVRFTDARLNVGEFTFDGETVEQVSFDLFMGEFGPEGFTDVFGFAELTPDQFELDASGGSFSASVETELILEGQTCAFDGSPFGACDPIGPFEVTVVIEWSEATGRVYPASFTGRSHGPFGFNFFTSRSLARFTTATGEVTGEMEIVLGGSEEASISRETSTDRFRFTVS